LVGVPKDDQRQRLVISSLPFIRAETEWHTLSYAAVMTAAVIGHDRSASPARIDRDIFNASRP
jgi:hypothetical protein